MVGSPEPRTRDRMGSIAKEASSPEPHVVESSRVDALQREPSVDEFILEACPNHSLLIARSAIAMATAPGSAWPSVVSSDR